MNELIRKYPWLKLQDPYEQPDDEPITFFDWIPQGWAIAFGEQLCEDIDAAIKKEGFENEFQITEAKEKYGALELYFSHASQDLNAIARRYRAVSETICCVCGTIHGVKMITRGWVSPYCKECYGKITTNPDYEYFDNLQDEELPTTISWRRYSNNGVEEFKEDISNLTNKIKENYTNRSK